MSCKDKYSNNRHDNDLWFNRNIWENISNLKGKYNQLVFKCFDFSPFEVSCFNTYQLAVMWSQEEKVFSGHRKFCLERVQIKMVTINFWLKAI